MKSKEKTERRSTGSRRGSRRKRRRGEEKRQGEEVGGRRRGEAAGPLQTNAHRFCRTAARLRSRTGPCARCAGTNVAHHDPFLPPCADPLCPALTPRRRRQANKIIRTNNPAAASQKLSRKYYPLQGCARPPRLCAAC